jgi:hypothetical protein
VASVKGISKVGEDPGEERLTLPLREANEAQASNEQLTTKFAVSQQTVSISFFFFHDLTCDGLDSLLTSSRNRSIPS